MMNQPTLNSTGPDWPFLIDVPDCSKANNIIVNDVEELKKIQNATKTLSCQKPTIPSIVHTDERSPPTNMSASSSIDVKMLQDDLKQTGIKLFQIKPEKVHECEMCGRCFSRKSFLKNHWVTHTGEKPFQCPQCNMCFTLKASMKRHVKTTHSEEKLYKCPQCDKAYAQQYSLACHLKTHMVDNPNKCSVCGKGMINAIHLERHLKQHRREKLNKCGQCDKIFSTSIELKNHVRIHSNKSNVNCEECGKVFSKVGNLNIHMKSHSEDRPHMCDLCGKCFSILGHLHRHMKKFHGKPIEKKIKLIHIDADEDMVLDPNGHFSSRTKPKFEDEVNDNIENLVLHMCAQCGKCFIREDHLRKHVKDLSHNAVFPEEEHMD